MTLCYYEGYIRNRRRLCRDLKLPDWTAEPAILEAGYRRWGADLVHRLYGAFAFAFLSPDDDSFFCARDQFGLQPFFYCLTGNNDSLISGNIIHRSAAAANWAANEYPLQLTACVRPHVINNYVYGKAVSTVSCSGAVLYYSGSDWNPTV